MLSGIAAHPASWGVFSWNEDDPQPWATVLDEMAQAGYRGLELGRIGFFPTDPGRLREELAQRELQLVAGFVVAALDERERLAAALEAAASLCALLEGAGARHLVVLDAIGQPRRSPTAGRSEAARRLDDAAWRRLVEATERLGELAARHGLTTAFHAHAGTHVEFEDELERLLADTDPELVGLCLDTGHSIYAGLDPVALLERHPERVRYLHLKDVDGERLAQALARQRSFQEAVADGVFCPLDEGVLDLAGLREGIETTGFEGWAAVEQDRMTPTARSAKADATASLGQLRAAGIVQGESVTR
jgi:inosose dehydratase